ncbi:hypothetical protein AO944_32260 [Pseudomonas aeruginosa]|nr:hypothetical protein AO944_32260 [Pseudomonas aeruginosa]
MVRAATPAGCRSPAGERGRNTDFTGWPSTEGQTGSQHALEGKTMRNHKGQFASEKQAMAADLEGFIADWKHWALAAFRRGDREDGMRCKRELDACRKRLAELIAC